MATMTVLGQDKSIRARIDQLQEMHVIVTGQISDLETQLEEREANKARIEGGIIELQALLAQTPTEPVKEEPDETDGS